jgi:hypothetical protein
MVVGSGLAASDLYETQIQPRRKTATETSGWRISQSRIDLIEHMLNTISPGCTITSAQELQVKTDADRRFEAWAYYWIPHNFTFSPDVKTWPGATCVLVYGSGGGGQNRVYRGFVKGFTIQFTG